MAEDGIAQRRLCWPYCVRARWIISPIFTSEGQATSQRLQLMQYFKRLVVQRAILQAQAFAVRPACFGPG
jgi:hypothetical protein